MAPEHTITGPHAPYRATSGLAPKPATAGPQRSEYSAMLVFPTPGRPESTTRRAHGGTRRSASVDYYTRIEKGELTGVSDASAPNLASFVFLDPAAAGF